MECSCRPENCTSGELVLMVSSSCNLDCRYCYCGQEQGGLMSEDTAYRALLTAQSVFRLKSIQLSGGEPLLNLPLIRWVAAYARDFGLKLKMQTNATLITPALAEELKQMGIQLGVSLDGVAKTHNCLRPLEEGNSFNQTLAGIKNLEGQGLKSGLTCVVSSANYSRLEELAVLASQLAGISGITFDLIRPSGRALAFPDLFEMNPAILRKSLYRAIWACYELSCLSGRRMVVREIERMRYLNESGQNRKFRCYFDAGCQLAVNPQGDIYPCAALSAYLEMNIGNVNTSLEPEILSRRLREARNLAGEFDKCRSCRFYLSLCGGPCPAQIYSRRKQGQDCSLECALRQTYIEYLNPELRKSDAETKTGLPL